MSFNNPIHKPSAKARAWDRKHEPVSSARKAVGAGEVHGTFKTYDGRTYAVHETGAIVRRDKDQLSVKERKRRRRITRDYEQWIKR